MNYSNINNCDVANGEGIRVSLFVSGCEFHCFGCFNKEAQDFNFGTEYTEKTHEFLCNLLNDETVDGLSLLGGDPLWQSPSGMDNLIKLCEYTHSIGKNVWIWTGFTFEQIFFGEEGEQISFDSIYRQKLIANCDVLVDGRFDSSLVDLSLDWRGSSNQRVIDVQKSMREGKVILHEAKGNA